MNIIFKIIIGLYYISLYLGLFILIVVIPLWLVEALIPSIESWIMIVLYASFTAVYVEISDKYFKLDLS